MVLPLPAEIWDKILEFAPNDTLMKAKLVSRTYRESSDRSLFRTITLRNSRASARSVSQVLASERLKGYVRTLHIIPQTTSLRKLGPLASPLETLVPEIRYALSDMCLSPTLTSFILDFEGCEPSKCVSPILNSRVMDAFRSDLLCLFITTFMFSRHGLSRSPMRALSIRNLQSRCEDHITDSSGFSTFVNNLNTLELSILTVEHDCVRPDQRPMDPRSWNFYTTLPRVWLTSARQLTKLRLSADSHWGYHPRVDFRNVSFKSLKKLVLDNFTFSHDWQQLWFLRHSTTLIHLVLSRCSMLRDVLFLGNLDREGYPTGLHQEWMPTQTTTYTYHTGWSDYLNATSESLTKLRYFSMIGENDKSGIAEELATILQADRYLDFKLGLYSAVADRGTHDRVVDLSSQISQATIAKHVSPYANHLLALARQYQDDEQALRDLLNKVAQRNMAMGK